MIFAAFFKTFLAEFLHLPIVVVNGQSSSKFGFSPDLQPQLCTNLSKMKKMEICCKSQNFDELEHKVLISWKTCVVVNWRLIVILNHRRFLISKIALVLGSAILFLFDFQNRERRERRFLNFEERQENISILTSFRT